MAKVSTSKVMGGSIWLIASYGIARCLQFISQVVLARFLSPEEFGVWAMVLILSNLAQLFSESSTGQVLVQRGLGDRKLVNTVYSLGVNLSIALFIGQALLGYPLSVFFGVPKLWPMTALAAVVFLIRAGSGTHNAVMMRQMKFRETVICNNSTSVVKLLGTCICALLGAGVWSFIIGDILAAINYAAWSRSMSGYRFTYYLVPEWSKVKEIYSFILGIMGINLGVYANTTVDNLILGRLFGPQTLGFYNVAYQLAMLPFYVLSRSNQVNFTVLARQSPQEQQTYIRHALEINAIIAALINGLALIMSPWLIPFVYGSVWADAVGLFQILLVYSYARGFMAILGTFLNAINKPGLNARINWTLVLLTVPAYFLSARLGGALGVAIAVALVMGGLGTAWFWFVICRTANWNLMQLARPVLIPTLGMGVTLLAVLVIPLPPLLSVVLQPLLLILGYSSALFLFSGGQLPETVDKLVNRLRKRY